MCLAICIGGCAIAANNKGGFGVVIGRGGVYAGRMVMIGGDNEKN